MNKLLRDFKVAITKLMEIQKYNYVVVNDQLTEAVAKIEAILLSGNVV